MNLGLPAAVPKLWRLSWRDHILLVQALGNLALARVLVALVRFRDLASFLTSHTVSGTTGDPEELVRRVRWAVQAWAPRVPWRALCFEQGLAAHLMLRRRGVDSVLYYGASPNLDGRLAAHVWVLYRGANVIGAESASQFAVLATFPAQAAS